MLCKEALFDSEKFCISNRGLSRILIREKVFGLKRYSSCSIDKILGSILSLKVCFLSGDYQGLGVALSRLIRLSKSNSF